MGKLDSCSGLRGLVYTGRRPSLPHLLEELKQLVLRHGPGYTVSGKMNDYLDMKTCLFEQNTSRHVYKLEMGCS